MVIKDSTVEDRQVLTQSIRSRIRGGEELLLCTVLRVPSVLLTVLLCHSVGIPKG